MKHGMKRDRFELLDGILFAFLVIYALLILVPFYNVIVVSFTSQKEFMTTSVLLFPKEPTLRSYVDLYKDGRVLIGYRTTLILLVMSLPLNIIMTTCLSYGMSRPRFPGKKPIMLMLVFTMVFNGGIIPMYMLMKQMKLINTLWSVVLSTGINTFYMIIMRNYFESISESLVESARLDGASEMCILTRIILPLSTPIIATVTLFYAVDRWNEWYYSMIFIRKANITPLQLILRNMITNSKVLDEIAASGGSVEDVQFSMGIKMGAVMVSMLPIMCVFPFLQRYFVKGIMVGAIKS